MGQPKAGACAQLLPSTTHHATLPRRFPPRKIYMGMIGTNWHGGYRIFPNATTDDSGSGGQVSPTPAPSPSGSGGACACSWPR